MSVITIGISDQNVAKGEDVLVTYALGSCVGICLYDPIVKVAGLSHIMLPTNTGVTDPKGQMRFADTAIPMLIRRMESLGASKPRLKAKIAGGAQMFPAVTNASIANIGQRNVAAVKAVLAQLRIPILAEDTGKDYGRTQHFYAKDGVMRITSAKKGEWIW